MTFNPTALLVALALSFSPSFASADAALAQQAGAHAARFQRPYARLKNAGDLYAAILSAQANGTADEKGWAGSALSTCAMFTKHRINIDPKLPAAEQHERRASIEEIQRRCSGATHLTRVESDNLRDALFDAMRHSVSELGRLNSMGAAPDGLSYRPLTDTEMSDLSKALHDDDPIVRQAVVGVIAGEIETSGRGRAYATAFQAALEPPEVFARLSELDGLSACVFDGVCGHDRSPAEIDLSWRTPKVPQEARLRKQYADADAQRLSVREILEIR
jgi:hypothetical protein